MNACVPLLYDPPYKKTCAGQYDIRQFSLENCEIKPYGSGQWYVCVCFKRPYGMTEYIPTPYLHKDGTFWSECGELNFFNSKKQARECLEWAFSVQHSFFTDEDLRIEI